MEIQTEWINLSVSDGTTMRAYVAQRSKTPRAALLVYQEIFDVNPHIRDITERFARQGYLAIAPELFHRTGAGFECGYSPEEIPKGREHAMQMKPPGVETDVEAAYAYAKSAGAGLPVAAIGFCMGGRIAFQTALVAPVACAISFYGGGIAPSPMGPGLLDRVASLKAPVMFVWGGKDTHIPPASADQVISAMRASAKPHVNVEFSEAEHGFFCDQRASYHPASAAVAWPMVLAYLEGKTQKAAGA